MWYLLSRLAACVIGRDWVVSWLRRTQRSTAWEIETHHSSCMMRRDPTYDFTVDYAEQSLMRADIAQEVGISTDRISAFEWAWVHSADALAVLEWKGLDGFEPLASRALACMASAEKTMIRERVGDLKEQHGKVKAKHNSLRELRFRERVAHEQLGL